MDADVIDLRDMTDEDRREHFRRLDQLTTCPCVHCTAVCDRASIVAECRPYQQWYYLNIHRRKMQRHR